RREYYTIREFASQFVPDEVFGSDSGSIRLGSLFATLASPRSAARLPAAGAPCRRFTRLSGDHRHILHGPRARIVRREKWPKSGLRYSTKGLAAIGIAVWGDVVA